MKIRIFLVIFLLLYLKFDYLASAQTFFTVIGSANPNLDLSDIPDTVVKHHDIVNKKQTESVVSKPFNVFNLHLPLGKLHLTSAFGRRFHPIVGKWANHNGVDLRANYEPVYSISFGIVKQVGRDKRSGIYAVINNFNGIKTVFCHLAKILVRPGDTLKAGQPFAISGATGMVTGPHLHFGMKVNGKYINPLPVLLSIKRKLKEEGQFSISLLDRRH